MGNQRNLKAIKHKQKGMALPGYIIASVLFALGLLGVYSIYDNQMTQKSANDTIDIVNKAFDNLPPYKQQFGSYADLDNNVAWVSNALVVDNVKSPTQGEFTTPFSTDGLTFGSADTVTLKSGRVLNAPDQFARIDVHDVNGDVCLDIITGLFSRALEIRVGTTRVAGGAAATTQCAAAGDTVDLVFFGG